MDTRIIFIEGKYENAKKHNFKFTGYRIHHRLEQWYYNNGY